MLSDVGLNKPGVVEESAKWDWLWAGLGDRWSQVMGMWESSPEQSLYFSMYFKYAITEKFLNVSWMAQSVDYCFFWSSSL